ncbi:hypothetical protein AKUH3B101J_00610 [Apilactobacillus kunkeei]|nr:hypothetical protein AKUH4B202J_00570 [Apilactobacillus kunkeei]CAI2551213.1 hypothetical protein AKUH3B104J_00610 [Apilactobacillus kunkeei]CAI2551489.1 hypothetical protein AKUH3B101J_00610 [Apilactobacillus kunkeei]CAI2606728.1 hypothetical protein AKUH1B105A_00570 [Apilactobacillus kunkeei]
MLVIGMLIMVVVLFIISTLSTVLVISLKNKHKEDDKD